MTKDELILISAYTGFLLAPDFGEVHEACEKALGRPIFTHELASNEVNEAILGAGNRRENRRTVRDGKGVGKANLQQRAVAGGKA